MLQVSILVALFGIQSFVFGLLSSSSIIPMRCKVKKKT